jgi:hypothetical protein
MKLLAVRGHDFMAKYLTTRYPCGAQLKRSNGYQLFKVRETNQRPPLPVDSLRAPRGLISGAPAGGSSNADNGQGNQWLRLYV